MRAHKNVMVDLETLGTAPGSVILSIGAVAFNEGRPESEWVTFNSGPINIDSSLNVGLTVDADTVMWWGRQDAEASKLLTEAQTGGVNVRMALSCFTTWFPLDACIWGNGANFDEPLLTAAYRTIGCVPPYKYYASHCYRTMKNLFSDVVSSPAFQGVKHDALADALHQTRHLQSILLHIQAVR